MKKLLSLVAVVGLVSLVGCGGGNDNTGADADIGLTMVTPYVTQSDIAPIKEAYSSSANAPWGFVHTGIDFSAVGAMADFQAVCSGTIAAISVESNDNTGNWQIRVSLMFNHRVQIDYCFETMSASNTECDSQRAAIAVSIGQSVVTGDRIGSLISQRSSSHVDFGIMLDRNRISPEPYFTSMAKQSILTLLHEQFPGANMTY